MKEVFEAVMAVVGAFVKVAVVTLKVFGTVIAIFFYALGATFSN